MSLLGSFVACPAIQDRLNGNFKTLSEQVRDSSLFTEFVTSDLNTSNVLQTKITPLTGHKRQVQVIYKKRKLESHVSATITTDCVAGDIDGDTSHTYTLDTTSGSEDKFAFDMHTLEDRCEDDAMFVAREIQRSIDVLVRKINTDNITKAATLFGNFATSGNSTAINVKTKNTNAESLAFIPDAITNISFEYMRMLYNGGVALFSGCKDFKEYFDTMGSACCNTTIGLDLAAYFQSKSLIPFFDYKIDTLVGANKILALAPGALQMLTYNKYVGPKGIRVVNDDTFKTGIIVDPMSGISFDYMAQLVCEKWQFKLSVAHDLVALPNDIFDAGDYMSGVNWVNRFTIAN